MLDNPFTDTFSPADEEEEVEAEEYALEAVQGSF